MVVLLTRRGNASLGTVLVPIIILRVKTMFGRVVSTSIQYIIPASSLENNMIHCSVDKTYEHILNVN
jgi:hypothetical protein